jgi:hypothetical protein
MYKEYYNKLNLRFQLLNAAAIVVFVGSWMFTENKLQGIDNEIDISNSQDQIGILVIFLSLIASGAFHYRFHKDLMQIDRVIVLKERLILYAKYFNAMIIRLFITSALISVLYFFIHSQALIAAFAFVLVLTTVNRLTYTKIARQLKMDKNEQDEFFKD